MQVTVGAGDRRHSLNLDSIPAPLDAELVVQTCRWSCEPFVLAAPHQVFCGDKCRKASFRKAHGRDDG